MVFEMQIVSNTPLIGENDPEIVAKKFFKQIGYLSKGADPDVPVINVSWSPIKDPSIFQSDYPFNEIGKTNVSIKGRYSDLGFSQVHVTSSGLLKGPPLLGSGFVSLFSHMKLGQFEDKGYALHGFIEY